MNSPCREDYEYNGALPLTSLATKRAVQHDPRALDGRADGVALGPRQAPGRSAGEVPRRGDVVRQPYHVNPGDLVGTSGFRRRYRDGGGEEDQGVELVHRERVVTVDAFPIPVKQSQVIR